MDMRYFEIAKRIASTLSSRCADGRRNKARVVALLIPRSSNEIYIGTNKMDKFHARSPHPYKAIHAEFGAILNVGKRPKNVLQDSSIYVYRETSEGQGLAKPCIYCLPMLKNHGIKHIYYSDVDGFYSYTTGKLHDC